MHALFIDSACRHLGPEGVDRVARCLQLVGPEQLWQRPGPGCNSIGNLVLHLAGNVDQWIVCALGGSSCRRDRQAEFDREGGLDAAELERRLRGTVEEACRVLRRLQPADLQRRYPIQDMEPDGVEAVLHVVEHFSYHTGQISLLAKLATGADLGYYGGRDLD